MTFAIAKAAVLGSGVMGATIAAHLANVGIPSLLLDLVPKSLDPGEQAKGLTLDSPQVRNRIARKGLEATKKLKPAAFYVPEYAELITVGNFDDHLPKLVECDWIIEVVVERLDIKRDLLSRIEPYVSEKAIISSNTSGISIAAIAEALPASLRKRFIGTHFFNPPRYMKLLELIPTSETDQQVVGFMENFGRKVLGKGVVKAKDTPNFIANRIGVFSMLETLRAMEAADMTVEEVDAVTGPLIGRPKSATFRTMDVVGIDTFLHVARNVANAVDSPVEKRQFLIPPYIEYMVSKGWLGQKSGQGYYKTVAAKDGKQHWSLDLATLEHRLPQKPELVSLEAVKAAGGLRNRLKALTAGKAKESIFSWNVIKKTLLYSASHAETLADDLPAIDRAMRWGFNWEMGPFELWDALGVSDTIARMKSENEIVPQWVETMLSRGIKSFYGYEAGETRYYSWSSGAYEMLTEPQSTILLKSLKDQNKVVLKNPGASLIDIGDGVVCLEFNSPNNSIGADILSMVHQAVDEVEKNWAGMVIANQGRNFCVGANLMLILMEAQDEEWDEIEEMVLAFQKACMRLKYARKPIVAAPHAMCLGGGTEFSLHTSRIKPIAETYMGLVEVGVGLIPGGGGHKEMLYRAVQGISDDVKIDIQPLVNKVFETIAMGKVSTSAAEAKRLGFLLAHEDFTVNGDSHIYEAKKAVLTVSEDYHPPQPKQLRAAGETGYAVMKLGAYTLRKGGYISEYDEHLACKVAHVLSGGKVPANTLVSEQWLLDIEREAFMSLVGEPKSQARMQYMLTKGKPLRN